MSKGYFKVNRSIFSHALWNEKPFSRGQAWIDLIGTAYHSNGVKQHKIIERGQIWTTIRFLSDKWGWSRSSTNRFLELLEKEAMIALRSSESGTIITLCNYNKYNSVDEADSSQQKSGHLNGPLTGHQSGTLKQLEQQELALETGPLTGHQSGHLNGTIISNDINKNNKEVLPKAVALDKKLSKAIKPKVQKNGYNPITMWCNAVNKYCQTRSARTNGFENKYLTELGNMYSEDEFRAMLIAYGDEHEGNGKPWRLFDEFYKCHAFWRSKARVSNSGKTPLPNNPQNEYELLALIRSLPEQQNDSTKNGLCAGNQNAAELAGRISS